MENGKPGEVLQFLSNVSLGLCVGIIADYFINTGFVLTAIGAVAGIGLAIYMHKKKLNK